MLPPTRRVPTRLLGALACDAVRPARDRRRHHGSGHRARRGAARAARRARREGTISRSGTSSRSSRLIHGGVRYLEHGHFHLVFESSGERRRCSHIAPHLVRPLRVHVARLRGRADPALEARRRAHRCTTRSRCFATCGATARLSARGGARARTRPHADAGCAAAPLYYDARHRRRAAHARQRDRRGGNGRRSSSTTPTVRSLAAHDAGASPARASATR